MSLAIIMCAIFSLVAAAVIPEESHAKVVEYQSSNDRAGGYKFNFKTSNGITRAETGYLVNIGQENEHIVVEGSYSYTDDEEKLVIVNYTADENGYRVEPTYPVLGTGIIPPNAIATLLG